MAIKLDRTPLSKRSPFLNYTPIEDAPTPPDETEGESFDYDLASPQWGQDTWQGARISDDMTSSLHDSNMERERKAQSGVVTPIRPYYKGATLNGNQLTADKEYLVTDSKGGVHPMTFKGIDDKGMASFIDENGQPYTQDSSAPVNENDESYLKKLSNVDYLKEQGLTGPSAEDMQKEYGEYMKNAPEYVSEEEQQRRLRASRSAKTIADLGSIASAFANLWGTSKGAYNQKVAYADAPDYQSLVDKWSGQRNTYRTYAQKGKDYVYNKQMQAVKDQYNRDLQKLNLEYKQAQTDLVNAKTTAEQQKETLAAERAKKAMKDSDRDYQLKVQALNQRQANDAKRLDIAYQNLGLAQQRESRLSNKSTSSSGGGKGGSFNINSASGINITIPKDKMSDFNRSELLRLCGSDGYKSEDTDDIDQEATEKANAGIKDVSKWKTVIHKKKKTRMTEGEQWTWIVNHLTDKAQKYIVDNLGGQTYKPTTTTQTPSKPSGTPTTKKAAASSTTASKSAYKVGQSVNGTKVAKVSGGKIYDKDGKEIIDWQKK